MSSSTRTPEQNPSPITADEHAHQSAICAIDVADLAVFCVGELRVLLSAIATLSLGNDAVHALAKVAANLAGERFDTLDHSRQIMQDRLTKLDQDGGNHA